jgi:glutaredoxin
MSSTMPRIASRLLVDVKGRVVAALERADELGGDLRDYLHDRWEHDPRLAGLKDRVDRWRGKQPPARKPAAPAQGSKAHNVAAAAAAAAAPVGAGVGEQGKPAAPAGLGKPELPAQIFGKKSCPWTGRAMTVLERHKVDYDFVDLEEPEHEKLAVPLAAETRQHTVPYVYLRGQFIGGYNALAEVERLGQLEFALMSAEERAKAPAHVRRVEIAARPNTDEVAPAAAESPATAE